jgi:hypothetical protein
MARPHRLEAKDAALSRQKPEFESRWGHLENQQFAHRVSSHIPRWCPQSVYRLVQAQDSIQTLDRLLQMIGRQMGIPRGHAQGFMAEQLLNGSQIKAPHHQVPGEGVSEVV